MTLQELKVLIAVQTKPFKDGMKEVQSATQKTMDAVKTSTSKMETAAKKSVENVKASTAKAMDSVKSSTTKASAGTKKALAAVKSSTDGLQSSMNRLIGAAKALVSTAAITSAAKQAVAAAQEQEVAETKLATIMRQRMHATDDMISSIKALTSAEQRAGIIGDEVQLAGAQQLSTFLNTTGALQTLIPAMNDLVAQQKGYSASAGDAVNVGNLMGKVMQGQTSALTRVGITFTEAEEAVLKYGNEQERAAMLAQVITNNVGHMNSALAKTPYGRIQALKNNFGDLMEVIGGSIANVLSPVVAALNTVIVRVISAANAFKSFTAMLTGQTAEPISIAADTAGGLADAYGDVADSANDAAGASNNAGRAATAAAAAIKRATMSFDQLHKLSGDSSSGGSGGGGGGGAGGGGGGGTITGQTYDFGKLVEDGWEFKGMEALGDSIATAVANGLDSIQWEPIYEKARVFGTGLADFLNGLFKPENKLFAELGDTIAGGINTGIEFQGGFTDKLKFDYIGTSVGQGINNALKGIKWTKALTNAKKWGKGIATAANSFLKETDFTLIGETVGNFISTKVASALSFSQTFNFGGLGKKIAKAINGTIKKTDFAGTGEAISNFVSGGIDAAAELLKNTDFKELAKSLRTAIGNINWGNLSKAGGKLMGALIKAAVDSVSGLFGDFVADIKKTFVKGFNDHVTEMTDAGVPLGDAIMSGIGNGIAAVLKKGTDWFKKNILTPFVDGFKAAFVIGSPAKEASLVEAAGWVGEGILEGIAAKFTNVVDWVKEHILAPISSALGGSEANKVFHLGVGLVKEGWNGFTSWLLGDKNGTDESGEVSTTNKVTNSGTKVRKFLTGNDDGTTTTKNTANNTRGSWYEKGKGFLGWLTGGSKKGATTTTNTAGVQKSSALSRFSSFLSWLTGGDKNGNTTANTTAKVNPYYGGWTSLRNQITQSNDGTVSITVKAGVTGAGAAILSALGKADGGIYAGGQWHDIAKYAQGGMPRGSQLFLAREAGPELVGTIGGHTAVVNNGQIVSSVASGVYNAVVSAFAAIGNGGGQAPTNEIVVMIDGETMYRIVKRGEKAYNGRYSTVCQVG